MNTLIKGTATLAAAFVAVAGIAQVAHAATTSTVTVRAADLSLTETRSAGHVDFLTDGLHVYTDDSSSLAKAAGYFAVSGPLPTSASLTWFGTQPQPGQQIVVDADNDGAQDGILVGEPVYGSDWWLTNGSKQFVKDGAPEHGGGFGSENHGTLAQWLVAFPNAQIMAGGFSLGSGVKGDGVVDSITYGSTTYRFTSVAATPAPVVTDVTGHSTKTVGSHGVRLDLYSDAQPANTVLGAKLAWKVKADGKTVFKTAQGFGDHDRINVRFAKNSGKHLVQVFKNGVEIRHFMVKTA